MRLAQRALSGFLPLIDWPAFERRNCNEEVEMTEPAITPFCCADGRRAVLWLLRRDTIRPDGRLDPSAEPVAPRIVLPEFTPATYRVVAWDTLVGLQGL